jgi:hypothetical protein
MFGEFCLMRGVDDGCLVSLAQGINDTCEIKLQADHRIVRISCPISAISDIDSENPAHLASPDGLCCIEREGNVMKFRFLGVDRKARSYEIESVRFDAALAVLGAGQRKDTYASLG